jgi:hypothetical protein
MPTRPFFDLMVDGRTYRVVQLAPQRGPGDVTWLVSFAGRHVCSVRYGSSLFITRQQLEAVLAAQVRQTAAKPGSGSDPATSE